MLIGFDADQDCTGIAEAAAAKGAAFCCRYFKNMSVAEARALSDAGLLIVSIFETTANRALAGRVAGTVDGARSLDYAKQIGQPPGSAVYATVDFGETADDDKAVMDYLSAFKTGLANLYKLGVYAEGAVCQGALDRGIADYTWLAGGLGMRGSRMFAASAKASIEQDVGDEQGLALGISIDSDRALVEDYGGWSLPAAPPMPTALDLQRALNARGANLSQDGVWGPRSAAALAAYYRHG